LQREYYCSPELVGMLAQKKKELVGMEGGNKTTTPKV
jgi:hypothetical protein